MTDKIVVLSTCASVEEAQQVARALVEKRLAACVNVMPGIRSVYRWKDAIEDEEEVLLLIKTSAVLVDRAETALRSVHSYQIPEFLVFNPESGDADYIAWLIDSVQLPE